MKMGNQVSTEVVESPILSRKETKREVLYKVEGGGEWKR